MDPDEELRRAQELLRVLHRRGETVDVVAVARAAGLHEGAVRAATRGTAPEPRVALPPDGSPPNAPDLLVRELGRYPVPASELVRAELGTSAEQVWVRETLVERAGRPLQFRTATSEGENPAPRERLVRPVDVEAVRADEDSAGALGVGPGTVLLLQVVLSADGSGARCLEFVYSRADAVRVLHP